jgi:hypothetical protein
MHGDLQLYVNFWAELCFGRDRPHSREDETALLLTTCNRPGNFLAAYKVGAYSWFLHRQTRFSRILNDIKVLAQKVGSKHDWATIGLELRDLATRLVQSNAKKTVWNKACLLTEKIEDWSRKYPYRQGVWRNAKRALIGITNFTEREQAQYDHLCLLYPMCRSATSLLRAALAKSGLVSPPPDEVGGFQDHIDTYNALVTNYGHLFPSPLQKISQEQMSSSDDLGVLKIITNTLETNYAILYGKFDEIRRYDLASQESEELDSDVAIVMYDIMGYSDWTPQQRRRMDMTVDQHMRPYLERLGEGKYYRSVLNDENAWVISDTQKALKASGKLLEVLRGEGKFARIAIHHTSPSNRVVVYKRKGELAVGGDCFIIGGRLREKAEQIQKSRTGNSNVILLTYDAQSRLSEEMRRELNIGQPIRTLVQGKSVGEISFHEIAEDRIRSDFVESDWQKIFSVRS